MQSESRWTPHGSNPVVPDRRPCAYALTAETSSAVAANWLEKIPERTGYRDPSFRMALAADPIRILIVADFSASVQIATLVHSIGRFETRMACSADAAMNIAGNFLPNIALVSTNLPDLASYHLASALRWHSRLSSLRLIALTDDIPSNDRRRAFEAGFEQYLTLPLQQAALESALVSRLGSHPRGRDLRSARMRPN
jgi:PleD family two-component response regulator